MVRFPAEGTRGESTWRINIKAEGNGQYVERFGTARNKTWGLCPLTDIKGLDLFA